MSFLTLKTSRLQTAAILLLWLSMQSVALATHYKVYLIGGQSNASGRGNASELSALYDSPQTDVAFYWHKELVTDNGNLTQDTWLDLQPDAGQGKNSPSGHAVEFGPEITLGRTLADAYLSENIAIIKFAYGGSNLHTQWADGGAMYGTFVTTVTEALAALTDAGHTYELIGMIWQQGEADAGNQTNANNYEENLKDLIARVRTDIFGGLNLPFVIGGLSINQYSKMSYPETVRLAQETVATNVAGCGFSNADDCAVYTGNEIHFNATGQLALGAAHAAEMIRLEALDVDYDGLSADLEAIEGTDPNNPDSDGDGQKDGFEFRAGTSPTNAASLFEVISIVVTNDEVSITWPSKAGNEYTVEHSEGLAAWEEVDSDYPATGTHTVWSQTLSETNEPALTTVLARYDAQTGINGDFNTTAFDSVDTEGITTATRLEQGGSLTGGGAANFVLANGLFDTSPSGSPGFNLADATTANQSSAATAGDWFAFTLQADDTSVSYDVLSFYTDQWGAGGKLDISYTIGATEIFILQGYTMPEGNGPVELKTVDFDNFSSTNDVVWTFYLYGAAATKNGHRFDDITLRGAVATTSSSVIALYDAETGINGDFNTTSFDSVDAETSTTATRLTQGGALTGGGQDLFILSHSIYDQTASGSHGFNLAGTTTASQSAATTVGDWFSFAVESNGNTVEYDKLTFYTDQYGTGGKLDISYTIGTTETFIIQGYVMLEGNVPLAYDEVDFVDFSSDQNVIWTFYLYGAAAEVNGNRFDDITLYGTSDGEPTTEDPVSGFYRVNLQ